ncbi:hypothetical protein HYH03_012540 [Edaphochlamys debaryana]|nr:hypothetical protein HYH03_012540 [Edaphochlamys debaryana]|eukprot:KAG2488917.1 hypothetical protein HYH03_012540 [Edaphochlamys debaryana]
MSGRPKRAPKRSKKYDEDDFEEDPSDLSEEVPLDDDESTEPDSEDEKPKKKRKAPPPRAKKQVQAFIEETGWSFQPPSLLYKAYGDPAPSNKIAAFDLDGTLANQKSNAQFPKDQHDYKLYNDKVIDKLLEYQRAGYKVVVFTNQGSIKTAVTGKQAAKIKARIDNIMAELGIDAQVFAATIPDPSDPYRKPATGMWDFMCLNCNGGLQPDKSQCIYVGDAAGRAGDFAASDKQFAHNAGLAFHTPEEIFG